MKNMLNKYLNYYLIHLEIHLEIHLYLLFKTLILKICIFFTLFTFNKQIITYFSYINSIVNLY